MKAKKGLLAVLCGFVMGVPVAAETRIGAVGGVNLATLHLTPGEEGFLSARTLPAVGGVVDVSLGRRLSLRFEPMWMVKGSDVSFELFGPQPSSPNGGLWLSYVELPVLLRLSFGAGSVRPYLLAGPTVGYLLSAKSEQYETGEEEDTLDVFDRTDLGISAGGGLSVPAGVALFFVEGRYSLGLKNIAKDSVDSAGETLKTRGVYIAVGVTFRLGHP